MKQTTGIKREEVVATPKDDVAVSSIDAGKTLCELFRKPLINDGFQAWEYGPVAPNLYHRVKGFGSGLGGVQSSTAENIVSCTHAPSRQVLPIQKMIFWEKGVVEGSTQFDLLHETMTALKNLTGAQLVSLTHWEKGAWYQRYRGGKRGIPIPDDLIKEEYSARQ